MKKSQELKPVPFQDELVQAAGELAASVSFNRTLGQIYGLLYIHSDPLSLDDISGHLKISKGNASINLRVLESWRMVSAVWKKGSRKDYYTANRDLKEVVLRRIQEGMDKRMKMIHSTLDMFQEKLSHYPEETPSADIRFLRKNISEAAELVRKAEQGLRLISLL